MTANLEPMLTAAREDCNGMEPAINADTFDAKMEALQIRLQAAHAARTERASAVRAAATAEFVAAGGCPECLGAGGHSSLDMEGYSMYWPCSRANENPTDYDWKEKFYTVAAGCTPEFRRQSGQLVTETIVENDAEFQRTLDTIGSVNEEIAALEESRRIRVGRRVVVISGRKVPKGTAGTVVAMNEYRLNIGYRGKTVEKVSFVDFDGKTWETSIDNVKCLGTPAPTDPDAKAATAQEEIKKGDRVRVVREVNDTRNGITHPVGCEGSVFWTGLGRGGKRLGFRDSTSTVRWANAVDVEVVR